MGVEVYSKFSIRWSGQIHVQATLTQLTEAPRYQSLMRLCCPQSRSGHFGENKSQISLPRIEPGILDDPTPITVKIPATLFWLCLK
jgi:hypothetical protein